LNHPPESIWPVITAKKSSYHALKNQLWTVTPAPGTQFTAEGDNLRSGLSFLGREIVKREKGETWGFATPVTPLVEEDVDRENAKHHINARRVSSYVAGEQVSEESSQKAPTAYRATIASSDVPRTKVHRIPDEEIKSRGLRSAADAA
jgi:hypothetical protein